MYGLSSRESMAKTQTRWVKTVEDTVKTITVRELERLEETTTQPHLRRITALEQKLSQLETRIAQLEQQIETQKPEPVNPDVELEDTTEAE